MNRFITHMHSFCLLIKHFVSCRFHCGCRCGLLKLPDVFCRGNNVNSTRVLCAKSLVTKLCIKFLSGCNKPCL